MENNIDFFKKKSLEIGIDLSRESIDKFFKYMEILKEWNKKINLTAITEKNEIILKHFIDSLTIFSFMNDNDKVIDIGTGAGFPGIPLKISKNINLTLLDSLKKRIIFLQNVIDELNLENVECIHGRTEDIARQKKYREVYDVATARAVARLNVLAEYCLPYVKINGAFICMKGPDVYDEIAEANKSIEILGGEIDKIDELTLPGTDIKRTIVVIKKVKKSPVIYPRKAGKPSKDPIK